MVMRIPYAEEYQNNTVSQISEKILHMRKQLKPGIPSACLWALGLNIGRSSAGSSNPVWSTHDSSTQ